MGDGNADYRHVKLEFHSGNRVSISALDDEGYGHGYRIAGPKFVASNARLLLSVCLTARDRDGIRRYLDLIPEEPDTGSDEA